MEKVKRAQENALEELNNILEEEKEAVKSTTKIDELENKKQEWFR